MRIPSFLTSILAIASLLLGNVAGWMHVGHHCTGMQAAAPLADPQEATPHEAHACCHHQCQPQAAEAEEDAPTGHEHDSDRCSVCQNFFASRVAAIHVGDEVRWQPAELFERAAVEADSIPTQVIVATRSSRGPPCA